MSRKSGLATPWQRGVTRVDDLHPMHDSAIRRAGAAIVPGDWATHDPFLSMMNDRFAQGAFGPHPHRGIETVTYVLNGSLTHHDNRGGRGVLEPGDVQWMTAGRGVVHLEDALDGESAHVLQLWINLPAAGDLTLHGVTKPVTLVGNLAGVMKDPMGNLRAGFVGEGAGGQAQEKYRQGL